MKLNKNELKRINDTIEILESIKNDKTFVTDSGTLNNIKRVLNINFQELKKKRDVETFVKGKEQHIIEYHNTKTTGFGRRISSYFYFPFQIKKEK